MRLAVERNEIAFPKPDYQWQVPSAELVKNYGSSLMRSNIETSKWGLDMEDSKVHLMVIGAHAADAEIMAGAIVAKYVKEGHRATLVHVTLGEAGHPSLGAADYGRQKEEEAKRAAAVLGADLCILPYKDAELEYDRETVDRFVDLIRETKPDLVITHWKGSFHRDHEYTSLIVSRACGLAGLPAYQRPGHPHRIKGLYYAENWEDPYDFSADVLLEVDDASYTAWRRAVQQYELFRGGISDFAYLQYYEGLFLMRGALGGFQRANALMRTTPARGTARQWLPI